MLKYAKRYYKRQFINRKQHSGKITTQFDKILQQHIRDGLLVTNGLPSVSYLADKLTRLVLLPH